MNIHEKIRQMAEGYEALTGRPVASLSVAEYLCFYDRASSMANQEIIFPSTSFSPPAAENSPAYRAVTAAEEKKTETAGETAGMAQKHKTAVSHVYPTEKPSVLDSQHMEITGNEVVHGEKKNTKGGQEKQNSILSMLQSVSG